MVASDHFVENIQLPGIGRISHRFIQRFGGIV